MPQPCARHRDHTAAGFTLIELLVVLVIFGIALGLVAVRLLPDDLALARREAQNMALLLERAADESESSGHVLAWRPDTRADHFETLDADGHWQGLAGDDNFHDHTLPGALRWGALTFTGADPAAASAARLPGTPPPPAAGSPTPSASAGSVDSGADAAPRLIFLPGQAAPEFSIEVQAGLARVQLKGDGLGRVAVRTLNDGNPS